MGVEEVQETEEVPYEVKKERYHEMRNLIGELPTLYAGIDPEEKGAAAGIMVYKESQTLEIIDTVSDPRDRAFNFKQGIMCEGLGVPIMARVVIEDAWIYPNMAAQAMTPYIKSQGIWLGILGTSGIVPTIVAARTWKAELNEYYMLDGDRKLSSDKAPSYYLARALIEDMENGEKYFKEYLRTSKKVPDKLVFDRCEAFLMAVWGMNVLTTKLDSEYEYDYEQGPEN